MIVSNGIAGNIRTDDALKEKSTDRVELEWFDTEKRILRVRTVNGQEIGFRNLSGAPLQDGDILFEDEQQRIVVSILPCLCLIFHPRDSMEMARVCFEIGNRHLPIYINETAEVILAYESPLHQLLVIGEYQVTVDTRVILQTHTLKMHAWSTKTKFNITLAKSE
ncbi:urease accessory protein UreE [Sphingobacterium haloxyli]|uniref:urease accessory protein UreE n=1 Tax=Sphingobacterium haloxyli TaxID=2100533 RepID=UPI001FB01101|nr:urease accessory protein UreE [Sphingobacterium haloxyli]